MPRAFLIRLVLVTILLVLLGVLWNEWWGLVLLPAFLLFLWLRVRRGASSRV
jgi:hypothetical protein